MSFLDDLPAGDDSPPWVLPDDPLDEEPIWWPDLSRPDAASTP
jgi:hypothetical protein